MVIAGLQRGKLRHGGANKLPSVPQLGQHAGPRAMVGPCVVTRGMHVWGVWGWENSSERIYIHSRTCRQKICKQI